MTTTTLPYDAAEHLDTPEAVAAYLEAAFEDGDPAVIGMAIGAVARARGMSAIARETGLSRESLYRSLGPEGRPEFATVMRVLKAFNVRVSIETAADAVASS